MRLFLLIFILILGFIPQTQLVVAQGDGGFEPGDGGFEPGGVSLPNPLGSTDTIPELLETIVSWLVLIASPIAAGMIIYGAFQILFAAGDPEKFKIGKRTILYTVVAYAIIFIGWGIVSIIEDVLGGATL